ncbi:hypothetical protein ANCDUO_05961 [Ancylostoma duodenale]|uniref:Uncharacterized protein n=1 Tax=Ancylostoma duodenale TaxID=51022 RepID=A0A0C2DM92_9BILA|nr:hypothetical protein ANCDUO_05961 [Ancylostoma duodenale]
MEVDNETSVVSNMDKVGNAWLPMLNSRKQQKKLRRPSSPEFTYEVHSVPMATRGGLLASYKEITCESSTRPAAVARAEARTQRVQSDTALAISDLEAICQLADSMDDDSKTSTPSLTARPSTSPAPRPPGCVGGNSAVPYHFFLNLLTSSTSENRVFDHALLSFSGFWSKRACIFTNNGQYYIMVEIGFE